MSSAKLLVIFLLTTVATWATPRRPAAHRPRTTTAAARRQPARAPGRHRPAKPAARQKHAALAASHRPARKRPAIKAAPIAQRRPHLKSSRNTHATASRGQRAAPARRLAAPPAGRAYTVTATVYQAVAGQTDGSPFITADNSRIRPRYGSHTRWLALSPDLLKQGGGRFRYGDKVQVSRVSPQLDGLYTVHDTMNRRHRHRIDILTHRREKLSVFAPGAKLRLAPAPRKSRAQATAAAHARPGRKGLKTTASHQPRRAGRQQAG